MPDKGQAKRENPEGNPRDGCKKTGSDRDTRVTGRACERVGGLRGWMVLTLSHSETELRSAGDSERGQALCSLRQHSHCW